MDSLISYVYLNTFTFHFIFSYLYFYFLFLVTFPVRVHPRTCKYTKKVFGTPIKYSAGSFFTDFQNREGISCFNLELVLSLSFW